MHARTPEREARKCINKWALSSRPLERPKWGWRDAHPLNGGHQNCDLNKISISFLFSSLPTATVTLIAQDSRAWVVAAGDAARRSTTCSTRHCRAYQTLDARYVYSISCEQLNYFLRGIFRALTADEQHLRFVRSGRQKSAYSLPPLVLFLTLLIPPTLHLELISSRSRSITGIPLFANSSAQELLAEWKLFSMAIACVQFTSNKCHAETTDLFMNARGTQLQLINWIVQKWRW